MYPHTIVTAPPALSPVSDGTQPVLFLTLHISPFPTRMVPSHLNHQRNHSAFKSLTLAF